METKDYSASFQIGLIELLISDSDTFSRIGNILRPEYFEPSIGKMVEFILEYTDKYKGLPTAEQIKMETNYEINPAKVDALQESWLLDVTVEFCKYRAIENVILDGNELLNNGQYADMEKRLKDALTISLVSDLGCDYFKTAKERIERIKDRSNMVSSGWETLDKKLNGGYDKGSLNVFAGGSGSGKSLILQNNALTWALMKKNVVYISLELSEDLVGQRIDAMVTGLSTSEIMKNSNEMCHRVETLRRNEKPADLIIKKMSEAGTTCNDIKAYLKELEIKTGKKIDGLLVDYLDLLHPNNSRIDVSNAFVKDKYVSEELRSIANEWNIPVVTASQLNRSSIEAEEFDHSHIAGGISKINTADNVFGIFVTPKMKDEGRYKLQFLKTRSSSAVGSSCELAYNPNSMRISDNQEILDNYATVDDTDIEIVDATREKMDDMLKRISGK